jgi:hypothetical protein
VAEKKTTRVPAAVPNPLQRMFGTYLRLERKRLSLEIGHVAETLGLAETYYRLVESGRATFNQGLSFKLIGLFASRSAFNGDIAPQNVRFHRLALYLVGAQCVSVEMMNRGAVTQADLRAMEVLAEEDADFERFHHETKDYYSFDENDERQRSFLENTAAAAVAQFLTTDVYVRPTDSNIVEKYLPAAMLTDLPTLNLEMVTRMVVDLSGRPFVHTPPFASAWEDRTARQIRAVSGLFEDADFILNETNLEQFHYLYLWERYFRELRFIFCGSTTSPSASSMRKRFITSINAGRKKAGLDLIETAVADKIKFVLLDAATRSKYQSDIDNLLFHYDPSSKQNIQFEAYWSFETAMGISPSAQCLPIGFVGSDFLHSQKIWNLALSSASQKREIFDDLWRKL